MQYPIWKIAEVSFPDVRAHDLADVPQIRRFARGLRPLLRRAEFHRRRLRAAVHARHIAAPAVFVL